MRGEPMIWCWRPPAVSPCPAPAAGPQFLYLHNLARHPDTGYLLATSGENTNPAVSALLTSSLQVWRRTWGTSSAGSWCGTWPRGWGTGRWVTWPIYSSLIGQLTPILSSDWSSVPNTQLWLVRWGASPGWSVWTGPRWRPGDCGLPWCRTCSILGTEARWAGPEDSCHLALGTQAQ